MQNGMCAVLDLEVYVAPSQNPINLISVQALHKEHGYKLVVGAADLSHMAHECNNAPLLAKAVFRKNSILLSLCRP